MMDSLLLYKILKNRTGAEISASGNPAIMSDTLKNNPMNEMKVFGWSKQESTTGAQLLDIKNVSSSAGEITSTQHDGYVITAQGVYAEGDNSAYRNVSIELDTAKVAGKIITASVESAENDAGETLSLICDINYLKPDGATSWNLFGMNKPITVSIPEDAGRVKCRIHIIENNEKTIGYGTYTTTIKGLMASIGDKVIPWEPYTGGQPSPSPDYPQEIVSAGAGGEVEVTICGKNLFDGNTDISKTQYYKLPIQMKKGAKLTMSFIGVGTGSGVAKAYCHDSELNFCNTVFYFNVKSGVNKYSSTITCSGREKNIFFYKTEFTKLFEKIYDIQIEINDVATDYTPYRESQSLSISIPTRLPAIPVDSDGNYTDANGQQWISDYVDLKRGKYVQNVGTMDLNDMQWRKDDNYISSSTVLQNFKGEANRVISSFVRFAYNYGGDCFFLDNNGAVYFGTEFSKRFSTLELFQVYLQEHDSIILYQLAEPIECDLTPEEIQAYKNLVTYAGTTIVENDAECYMEVSAGGGDALRAKKLALILGD